MSGKAGNLWVGIHRELVAGLDRPDLSTQFRVLPMRTVLVLLPLAGLVALLSCCSHDTTPSTPAPEPSEGAPMDASGSSGTAGAGALQSSPSRSPVSAPAPQGPIDPASTGTIRGVVLFEGEPPKPVAMSVTDSVCAQHGPSVVMETVLVDKGKLANVFVTVSKGLEKVVLPPVDASPVLLEQKNCAYVPHVQGMRVGQELRVRNGDKTTHNVNIRSSKNDGQNPTQPAGSPDIVWKPSKEELGVPLECNLHNWMKAFVCVESHPFFAVSATDGKFEIKGLPPGSYTLTAWHEKYGKQTAKATLEPNGTLALVFTFKKP